MYHSKRDDIDTGCLGCEVCEPGNLDGVKAPMSDLSRSVYCVEVTRTSPSGRTFKVHRTVTAASERGMHAKVRASERGVTEIRTLSVKAA